MKKQIVIAVLLGLAAVAAFGQAAKLTAPAPGAPWAIGTIQPITWTWSGAANVKLLLFSQSGGSIGIIKSGLALGAGSFPWTTGTLENGKKIPAGNDYKIRIITVPANTVLDIGPAFSIVEPAQTGQPGQPPPGPPAGNMAVMTITQVAVVPPQPKTATPIVVTISQPANGVVWIPLKTNYAVAWKWIIPVSASDNGGWAHNCAGCPVDVWIVPAAAPSQKVLLASKFCCGWTVSNGGILTYSGTYAGLTPSLASGNYFFRVAWSNKPSFYSDSQPFAVKSVISDDSAYLGPDPLQEEVDFALTTVFFDADGKLALRIKNLGQSFSGSIPVSYEKYAIGNYNKLMDKAETSVSFSANTNEEKNVILFGWAGYKFSEDEYTQDKYIPETTRPFLLKVKISPDKDFNPGNNSISKEMCMIKDPDIGTDGEIKLIFSPTVHVYINRGTGNKIHESKIKWLSENTFEAELEVGLWNYGGSSKTFDLWLYVDKLPGQLIGEGHTLQPGFKMTWKQPVKIKVPSRCGNHKLVFIADPGEAKNQPYPNSYMNNFINVTLDIICAGTIKGGL
jgi:hypothetical protein